MAPRRFTPEEANEALEAVRPLVEQMVGHRRALAEAQERQAAIAQRIAGNGGGMQPSELAEARAGAERAARAVMRCVEKIHAIGAQVKDLDRGLVDFPAQRGDREVLLCWLLGEDEVGYWHGLDEGFAGRRSLPLEP